MKLSARQKVALVKLYNQTCGGVRQDWSDVQHQTIMSLDARGLTHFPDRARGERRLTWLGIETVAAITKETES